MKEPSIKIKKNCDTRILKGSPWIFSNEIENFSELKNLEKGSLLKVKIKHDQVFALAYFNPQSLISARILSNNPDEIIDEKFFVEKIKKAKFLREKFFNQPFYRLIHSESDGLPGLVIDRFNDVFSCQISTAGMEIFSQLIINAINEIFSSENSSIKIIFRNDLELRRFEGLKLETKIIQGEIADKISVIENDLEFLIDVKNGQKTGWFFDQRINREFIGSIAKDCEIFDAFCYLGAFGFNALKNGAKKVVFADSSLDAIESIKSSKYFCDKVEVINKKIFDLLEDSNFGNRKFDIVNLDPPAFIKSKKDFFSGLKGYEKLVKLSANLVKNNGILMISSCSHHLTLQNLIEASASGFLKSKRKAKIIRIFGAGSDHPIHPSLKESEYLKSITFLVE